MFLFGNKNQLSDIERYNKYYFKIGTGAYFFKAGCQYCYKKDLAVDIRFQRDYHKDGYRAIIVEKISPKFTTF